MVEVKEMREYVLPLGTGRGKELGPTMWFTLVVIAPILWDTHKIGMQTLREYEKLANEQSCPKSRFTRKSEVSVECKTSWSHEALLDTESGLWLLGYT